MKIGRWLMLHPAGIDLVGYIPQIIRADDERPVVAQVNDRYAHGGGWNSFKGFKLTRGEMALKYPGDPALKPVAMLKVSEKETVYIYQHAWVLVDRGGEDWDIARLD